MEVEWFIHNGFSGEQIPVMLRVPDEALLRMGSYKAALAYIHETISLDFESQVTYVVYPEKLHWELGQMFAGR